MPTFEELRKPAEHTALMLKFRQLLVFSAPMSADPVESIVDENGDFIEVPEDYVPVGLLAKDPGVVFPRDVSTADEESVNHASPTRTDVESDNKQVQFTAQETKRTTLELAYGLDLSGMTRDAAGTVAFAHPEIPDDLQRRILVLARDPRYDIAAGKFLPCVEPTDFPSITWSPQTQTSYEITGNVRIDDELGYSVWDIPLCGPGALAHADAIGFEEESST